MKYLKQFLCGANILTLLPFYLAVYYSKDKKYSYFDYSLISPFWFGLWNVLSFIVAQKFNLTNNQRFIGISILTSLIVMSISTYFKTYDNTKKEWIIYYIGIFIKYLLIWNLIIRKLETNF
jgi:hypothetical protein